MQHFDEDMGELFRKASTEIRLRPLGDDWEKIKEVLLPDPVFLPATDPGRDAHHLYRKLMISLFLMGIVAVSSIVFRDDQVIKTVPGFQSVHDATLKSREGSTMISAKSVQKLPAVHIKSVKSVITNPALKFLTKDTLECKCLALLTPICREWRIQVGLNQAPGTANIIPNHVEAQEEKPNGAKVYVGIIAGPQFNQTKQQAFGNAGLSAGLVVGFRLNKRLSVETGFFISDKQFSSSGEYFDLSKISASMPSGMKLLQIQSTSTVLEIPLSFNYEVFKWEKGKLFTAVGVSSYIITKERNQYQASVNGLHETLTGNYSGHQSYFAATANMGLGYEWNTCRGLNLRVNPYVQIPLKTIGMGSMSVVSAGIYLGILFPIFK